MCRQGRTSGWRRPCSLVTQCLADPVRGCLACDLSGRAGRCRPGAPPAGLIRSLSAPEGVTPHSAAASGPTRPGRHRIDPPTTAGGAAHARTGAGLRDRRRHPPRRPRPLVSSQPERRAPARGRGSGRPGRLRSPSRSPRSIPPAPGRGRSRERARTAKASLGTCRRGASASSRSSARSARAARAAAASRMPSMPGARPVPCSRASAWPRRGQGARGRRCACCSPRGRARSRPAAAP